MAGASRKKKLLLALLALALLLVAAAVLLYFVKPAYPAPDFARVAEPLGDAEKRVVLPVFMNPQVDLDAGVGIVCVFLAARADATEVTVVWDDEDHPIRLFDRAYDLYRWFHFRRVMDVETFRYRHEGGDPRPASIDFADVYSGRQKWGILAAEHDDAVVPATALEWRGGRPVIYVNTWNHMFGESDNNPELRQHAYTSYPVYRGDRAAVERIFHRFRGDPE